MLSAGHPENVGHAYGPTRCLNRQSTEKKGALFEAWVNGRFWLAISLEFHPLGPASTLLSSHLLMTRLAFAHTLVLPRKVWGWPV